MRGRLAYVVLLQCDHQGPIWTNRKVVYTMDVQFIDLFLLNVRHILNVLILLKKLFLFVFEKMWCILMIIKNIKIEPVMYVCPLFGWWAVYNNLSIINIS